MGEFYGCDSCYECYHLPICAVPIGESKLISLPSLPPTKGGSNSNSNSTVNALIAEYEARVCCSCGEAADIKCLQCKDMFCSKTWMGFEGCFAQFHLKGNRKMHRHVALEDIPAYVQYLIADKRNKSQTKNHKINNYATSKI